VLSNSDGVSFQIPQGQRKLFPELQAEWLDEPIGSLIEILYANKLLGATNYSDKIVVLRATFQQDLGLDSPEEVNKSHPFAFKQY